MAIAQGAAAKLIVQRVPPKVIAQGAPP